jgi:hypothetical protein
MGIIIETKGNTCSSPVSFQDGVGPGGAVLLLHRSFE